MLEENKKFSENIKLQDYLEHIRLDIKNENLLDYIYSSNDSFLLSQFPQYVFDNGKYSQSEVFYQKFLDKKISKQDFLEYENKYHKTIQSLWLYDTVYVSISTDIHSYQKSYYAKKNKPLLKSHNEFIKKTIQNYELLQNINTLNELKAILYIGTRDISPIVLFFENKKTIVYVSGCSAIIYSQNNEFVDLIKTVSLSNGLFLLDNDS